MIDKSGIIPSGKQKGVPYSCRKGKVFKGREGAEERESISKECIVLGQVSILWRWGLLEDYLLVLNGKVQVGWLKVTFQEEVKTKLGIKSWFAAMGLKTRDSIWGHLSPL